MLASTEISFELDQFTWRGPDRLLLSGTFVGLRDGPTDPPVLELSGPHETQRLPAVDGTVSGPPADGQAWSAEFAWQEPPVPFAVAALHFGDAMVVELPEPGAKGFRFRRHALKVQVAAPDEPSAEAAGPAETAAPDEPVAPTDRVRLEAQLLVAQDEARELRAELEQSREELARARADLESEHARHAEDAQRFRDGLAHVQASAEAALAQVRGELEEAVAARRQADERTAAFETTKREAEAARSEAERLLGRLTAVRDALGDDS